VLQCVGMWCSQMPCVAECCRVLQCVVASGDPHLVRVQLQCVVVCCRVSWPQSDGPERLLVLASGDPIQIEYTII